MPTVVAERCRKTAGVVAERGVPGAHPAHVVAGDGGVAGGSRIVRRRDHDPVAPWVDDRVVGQVRVRGGGKADRVVHRLDDRVVGHGGVSHRPGVLAVPAVADVKGRLPLVVGVPAGPDDHVARHRGAEHVTAVHAEPSHAQADVARGVGDVIVLYVVAAAPVDPDALSAPRGNDGVVGHRYVGHGGVVLAAVVGDRVDRHAVVARATDEVVGRGQVASRGAGQRDVVQVAAVGEDHCEEVVLHRAAGAGGPHAGFDVLHPHAFDQPVAASRVLGTAAAVNRGAALGVRVDVEVLQLAGVALERGSQRCAVGQRDVTVDLAVPISRPFDRHVLRHQTRGAYQVESPLRDPEDLALGGCLVDAVLDGGGAVLGAAHGRAVGRRVVRHGPAARDRYRIRRLGRGRRCLP